MSTLKEFGKHLNTLDQSGVIVAGDVVISFKALARNFTVIVVSLVSDVDFDIDVLWSVDGINFAFDPADSIIHVGDPDHSFYERAVKGVFLQYRIENIDIVDSTIFDMKTYAKPGASIDFASLIPPPVPPVDVWWFRDPLDPAETTTLEPPNQGNLCFCDVTESNVADPATDYRQRTVLLGEQLELDYDNKEAFDGREFNRLSAMTNGGSVKIVGPGTHGCFLVGNRAIDFVNTEPGPGQDRGSHNSIISSNDDCTIWNMRMSTVNACFNSQIHGFPRGSVGSGEGQNFINAVYDSNISDTVGAGEVGCRFNRAFIAKAKNCRIEKDEFKNTFIFGTRIYAPILLPDTDLDGCFIITDDTKTNSAVLPDFLNITGADLKDKFHARFAGGYDFWTDNDSTLGVRLLPNSTAFVPICDERTKVGVVEYTDSAGILTRMSSCKVNNFYHKRPHETDPVKEEANFRITATAQDLNCVFHPEVGDAATQNAAVISTAEADYVTGRTTRLTMDLEKSGEKDPADPLTQLQSDTITTTIDAEMLTSETIAFIEKKSLMTLNMEEYIAALHLCIKELSKQVDLLKDRCSALAS